MSLLTAALFVLGGAFLTSGSDRAPFTTAAGAAEVMPEPAQHAVGMQQFEFARGAGRPLPTWVWYPTNGSARHAKGHVQKDAPIAPGQHPLLLWSHGFYSNPQAQESVIKFFVEAGYVVAAPAYPHTKKDGPKFDKTDVPNQAVDASFVITQMLSSGNPFAASIDPARVGAIGHSGGGTTTDWLFTAHRDPRLKVGIIIAGRPTGAYQGSPVPLLFLHGDHDPVVAYQQGRTSYAADPWPKAFLTIEKAEHGAGLGDPDHGHQQSMSTMLDFLRWTMDGDDAARLRLGADGTLAGTAHFESAGIYLDTTTTTTTATTTSTATTTPSMSPRPLAAAARGGAG